MADLRPFSEYVPHLTPAEEREVFWSSVKIVLLSVIVGMLLCFVIMCPHRAHAFDADIYTGFYQNSTLRSSPGNNNEYAEYVQGIKAGHNIGKFRMYGELQTLLDGYNGSGTFHPASIRYTTGVSYKVWKELTVHLEHMCWHPIDTGGRIEEYNMLLFNYHFGD